MKRSDLIYSLSEKENLTEKLLTEHNYGNSHLEILAELFYAQAELFYAQSIKNKSLEFYEKSLILLEFVIKGSKSFSLEKQARISYIKNRADEINKGET